MTLSVTPAVSTSALSTHTPTSGQTPDVPLTQTPTPLPTESQAAFTTRVTLPADDAPHFGVTTEWWYYNGHLRGPNGQRHGFHFVVFQVLLQGQIYGNVAHLSITDAEAGVYSTAQRASVATSAAGSAAPGFDFDVAGWRLSGLDGGDVLKAATDSYAIDLRFREEKRPVLHNRTGLVKFGEDGTTSYYYSRTRLAVSGTLAIGDSELAVVGEAWFDHQWGDFNALNVGWDWFALQLSDGSDVMLSILRSEEGRALHRYGTLVQPDGTARHLGSDDFTVDATDTWSSPVSGATYPIVWRLQVPSFGLELELTPVVRDSEFDATLTTRNFYWEGQVTVSGSHLGKGFVEMAGYAPIQPSQP